LLLILNAIRESHHKNRKFPIVRTKLYSILWASNPSYDLPFLFFKTIFKNVPLWNNYLLFQSSLFLLFLSQPHLFQSPTAIFPDGIIILIIKKFINNHNFHQNPYYDNNWNYCSNKPIKIFAVSSIPSLSCHAVDYSPLTIELTGTKSIGRA
jgi:hypothetical protein